MHSIQGRRQIIGKFYVSSLLKGPRKGTKRTLVRYVVWEMMAEQTGLPLQKHTAAPIRYMKIALCNIPIDLKLLVCLAFSELLLYIISSTQQADEVTSINYLHYEE